MQSHRAFSRLLVGALFAIGISFSQAQTTVPGVKMDRTALIAGRTFDVKMIANGIDVTARSPLADVRYNADGTGSRTLRDGRVITGSWRFLNTEQTQVEVQGPEGASRWVIIELNERIYRKANIDTGVEFIHQPRP
jgi:hypothetical protein